MVISVAWSPDGKRIVSSSFDETAQVWEPLTGKQFVIFRGQMDTLMMLPGHQMAVELPHAVQDLFRFGMLTLEM